jgi:4-amino-4-deoxy-L-arabinose transferase-like glycosyltransferase
VGLVVAAGAVARLAWAIADSWRPTSVRDPGLYLVLSEMVANGDGYRYPGADGGATAYYPPGYPVALGGVQRLVRLVPGDLSSFGVAIGFNIVLSVLTILLVFELCRRLFDPQVGLVAAGAIALWPNIVVHSGVVLTETLFLFLFVLMLLVALATREVARSPGWARVATVGLLFAMVAMVRPTSFVVAPVFLLLWWREGAVVALRRCAVVGAMVVALVLPWTIRNWVTMDALVLVSTNTGDNLCIGHNPDTTGGYQQPPGCNLGTKPEEQQLKRPESEVVRQSENVRNALDHIRHHPLDMWVTLPDKLYYTLYADTDGLFAATDYFNRPLWDEPGVWYRRAKMLTDTYYYVAGVAGIVGLLLLVRRSDPARRRLFFVVVCLGQLAAPALTFGDLRFKFPIYPALAAGAGVLAMAVIRRRMPDGDEPPASATAEPPATPSTPAEVLAPA